MANEIPDLWGNGIATAEVVTPAAILRQQASLLGPKTKNLVEAEVKVRTDPDENGFILDFNLVVPALGGYRYRLFRLEHGPELYPVTVGEGLRPQLAPIEGYRLRSEKELLDYLGEVLSSKRTTELVAALRAQAQG